MAKAETIVLVKELKNLGKAPEGHTYFGLGLGYWSRSRDNARKVYDECRNGDSQVIVWCCPDTEIHFGLNGLNWADEDGHVTDGCPHCRKLR